MVSNVNIQRNVEALINKIKSNETNDVKLTIDDGTSTFDISLSAIIRAFNEAHEAYAKCMGNNKGENLCYADAVSALMQAFGSAIIDVLYDEKMRYFALKTADYRWFIYDSETGKYRIAKFEEIVEELLRGIT